MKIVQTIIRAIPQFLLLIFLVSLAIFFVLNLLPGSSAQIKAGLEYGKAIEHETLSTLDVFREYSKWAFSALGGDWGYSEFSNESVLDIIKPRLKITLSIAFLSIITSLLLALSWVWWGEYSRHRYGVDSKVYILQKNIRFILERFLLAFIPLSMAVVILSIVSVFKISLFNLSGLRQLILPVLTLSLMQFSRYIRSLQESIDQLSQSRFVEFAYSLGYSHRYIWWREILPNALLFTLTLSMVQMSYLVGGTIIVEKIFVVPGLGTALVDAVASRDRVLVQAIITIVACMIGLLNMIFEVIKNNGYGRTK